VVSTNGMRMLGSLDFDIAEYASVDGVS